MRKINRVFIIKDNILRRKNEIIVDRFFYTFLEINYSIYTFNEIERKD